MNRTWRQDAACRTEPPELFFPVGKSGPALLQAAEAQAVCRTCPVMDRCAVWALEHRVEDGVWGGMTEDDRRAWRRRQARQKAARGGARQKADCGTEAAYRRHQKNGEPTDLACVEARRLAQAERAAAAKAKKEVA